MRRRLGGAWVCSVLLVGACHAQTSPANSQASYPVRPVRIVTNEPGAGLDFAARIIAQGLTSALGQQVIVENRGGAGGIIAADLVAKATPDGYTLLYHNNGIWTLPLMQSVPYDPIRDLAAITIATLSPNIVVVHPSLPVKTMPELMTLLRAKPGGLNYLSGGVGAPTHLAVELFNSMAKVNIVHVPYKGSGPALNALVGGEGQLMFAVASGGLVHVKSGRLRALAVTSAQRSAVLPDLPTVAESAALPGYEAVTTQGLFAPVKTPAALIRRINQETVRVLNRADVKEKFLNVSTETVGGTPEQSVVAIKADMARMGKLIKERGIRAE